MVRLPLYSVDGKLHLLRFGYVSSSQLYMLPGWLTKQLSLNNERMLILTYNSLFHWRSFWWRQRALISFQWWTLSMTTLLCAAYSTRVNSQILLLVVTRALLWSSIWLLLSEWSVELWSILVMIRWSDLGRWLPSTGYECRYITT